jgi:cellulose synthase/poly-beta-1,6-N-acetylglucosamine synthase-like glycosyltransferase
MGEQWINGTAIYYIMQVEEFSTGVLPDFLLNNSLFLVVAAYFSFIIKLAFPFSLFNRYTKYIVIFGIVAFHAGIAVQMGLLTFSAIMIAIDSLLLNDKEYNWIFSKAKLVKDKILNYMNVKKVKERFE